MTTELQNKGEATIKFRVKNVTTKEHNQLVALCVQAVGMGTGAVFSSPVHVLSGAQIVTLNARADPTNVTTFTFSFSFFVYTK